MKKAGVLVLLLTFALILAACGSGDDKELTILTGGEQGTYYPLGGALAQIINDNVDGMTATAVTSGASVVNINDIHDDNGHLALVQNDVAYYATAGINNFSEVVDNFYGIATLYPEVIQIVTAADSGISTVEDLRGKRVAVGDQGSGTEANARQILEVYGMTFDDITVEYMGFGDAANAIQDGNIDVAFTTAGVPTGAIEALKASKEITFVSMSSDKVEELGRKYPYYTSFLLGGDVYNTGADTQTVAVQAMLIASKSMSDDDVYEVTKAMFENLDVFVNTHSRGADITFNTALDGMSVDLHPGAKKYYDER